MQEDSRSGARNAAACHLLQLATKNSERDLDGPGKGRGLFHPNLRNAIVFQQIQVLECQKKNLCAIQAQCIILLGSLCMNDYLVGCE